MSWTRGQTIGSYRLLRRLGRGGFAEVWLAEQSAAAGFRRQVAVKLVVPEDESGIKAEALLREARLTSWIQDPHVVAVDRIAEADGTLLLAMEYCDGGSLSQLLKWMRRASVPMPPSIAVDIGLHIARALRAAHCLVSPDGKELCVVHRDLKPGNVLLTRAGVVKVCDFGIAKATDETHVTQTGVLKGTTAYIAPELWEDVHGFSAASDLFALGTLLTEMITLDRLHGAGSMAIAYRNIVEGDATEDALAAAPFLPPLVPLLEDLLRRDPAERLADADEVVVRLEELRESLPGSADLHLAMALFERIASRGEGPPPPLPAQVDRGWQALIEMATGVTLPLVEGPSGTAGLWEVACPLGADISLDEDLTPPEDPGPRLDPTHTVAYAGRPARLGRGMSEEVVHAGTAPTLPFAGLPMDGAPPEDVETPLSVPSSATLQGVPGPRRRRRPKRRRFGLVAGLGVVLALMLGAVVGTLITLLVGRAPPVAEEVPWGPGPASVEAEPMPGAKAQAAPPPRQPLADAARSSLEVRPPPVERVEIEPVAIREPLVSAAPGSELDAAPEVEPAPEASPPAPAAVPRPCLAVASRPTGAFVWLDGVAQPQRARSRATSGERVRAGRRLVSMALVEDGERARVPVLLREGETSLVRCDLVAGLNCTVEVGDASLCAD